MPSLITEGVGLWVARVLAGWAAVWITAEYSAALAELYRPARRCPRRHRRTSLLISHWVRHHAQPPELLPDPAHVGVVRQPGLEVDNASTSFGVHYNWVRLDVNLIRDGPVGRQLFIGNPNPVLKVEKS